MYENLYSIFNFPLQFRYNTGNLDDYGLVALEMSCTTPSFRNDQSPSNISMQSTANTALSASSGDWGTKLICPDDYFLVGFDLMVLNMLGDRPFDISHGDLLSQLELFLCSTKI